MTRRVIVIGAGFAGCMAAHELADADFEVEVLEARARVGGRVWSHRFDDGVVAELGAELIEDWYGLMLGIASERGLEFTEGPQRIRRFPFFDRGRRVDVPDEEILAEVIAALERLEAFVGSAAATPNSDAGRAIDAMTVRQGLDAIELAGVPRRWFDALISGWSCREQDEESLLHFALRRAIPQLRSGFAQSRWGRRLVGGNDQIARILLEPIADRVHLRARVRAIDWAPGRVVVAYETPDGPRRSEADGCVMAIPPQPLAEIAWSPSLPIRARAYGRLLGGCGAKVLFRHPPGAAPDPVFLSQEPRFHGWRSGDRPVGGVATMYLGGTYARAVSEGGKDGRQIAREWLGYAYPDTARAASDIVVAGWCTDPLTVTCGPVYPPGTMATGHRPSAAPVGDAMFFAGEHTSPDRFGSMEGALETGRRAAMEAIRVLA